MLPNGGISLHPKTNWTFVFFVVLALGCPLGAGVGVLTQSIDPIVAAVIALAGTIIGCGGATMSR